MKNRITILILFFSLICNAQYYVTTTGSSANDGLSEANAWSFTHADNNAPANSTVNVKAGNYGALNLSFTVSGVHYKGYVTAINDVVSTQYSTVTNTQTINASELPTLTGVGESSGTAISISATNVTLENIQITTYRQAINTIDVTSDGVHLKNIVADYMGTDSATSDASDDPYDGFGFHVRGDNAVIENCMMRNIAGEAFNSKGSDDGVIKYSEVYCDNLFNPTDYYFTLSGGSDNWIVEHNKLFRTQPLDHGGHGLMAKDQVTNSIFRYNTITGTSIEANFFGVTNVIYEYNDLTGYGTDSGNWHTRILFANGASGNIVRRNIIRNTYYALLFSDVQDAFVGGGGNLEQGGSDNLVENNIFINTSVWIQSTGTATNEASDNNTIRNNTVYNAGKILNTYNDWTNWKIYNNAIHTHTTANAVGVSGNGSLTLTIGSNNLIYNSTGTLPSWLTTSTDPLLTNAGGTTIEDYRPLSGSPLIAAGLNGEDVGYLFTASTAGSALSKKKESGISIQIAN